MPGFARVVDEQIVVFPDYSGNGMFRGLRSTAQHSAMFSYVSPEQRTEGPSVEIDPSFV